MELVSPIFRFETPEAWVHQLSLVWRALEGPFHTETNPQCSTHIHVSPSSGVWQLVQLKALAKCILFFERPVDAIMPGARRANLWCQSNRYNVRLRSLSMEQALRAVDSTRTLEDLVLLMCCYSKDSELGRSKKAKKDFQHTPFRWNFTPLCEGTKGTVEFRQPPGSTATTDSRKWIEFTVAYVQGAIALGDQIDLSRQPNLERLHGVVIEGARRSGVRDTSYVQSLFSEARDLPLGAYDLKDITPTDRQKFLKKADEKSITVEKFKLLYGYK